MTLAINDLATVTTLDNDEARDVKGGFYYFNSFYQPALYNWFYQPILPLNTFAGALNNGWAIRGAAFDRQHDNFIRNF